MNSQEFRDIDLRFRSAIKQLDCCCPEGRKGAHNLSFGSFTGYSPALSKETIYALILNPASPTITAKNCANSPSASSSTSSIRPLFRFPPPSKPTAAYFLVPCSFSIFFEAGELDGRGVNVSRVCFARRARDDGAMVANSYGTMKWDILKSRFRF